ncbi:MAG: ParA family protein [Deltaproteobacteria bacterium]|nr:ParA family protein [Deltaproteobacteria bacterium]
MKSLTLFNNTGGVGKTTLTFHLAHMMAREGIQTVALDYDPQANLTATFLGEEELEALWRGESRAATTVARCVEPVRLGKGEALAPTLVSIADNLWLLPGELSLSRFEQNLAEEWAKKRDSNNQRALDITFALDLLSNLAADAVSADVVLIDVGASLGALNRAALLACDRLAVPLAPDLFSLQGLENIGPTLREWREDAAYVRGKRMAGREQASLPPHDFEPIGYIVQQHLARVDRPAKGYAKWADQIPSSYLRNVLKGDPSNVPKSFAEDPNCIFTIRHMASLAPIAQLARKPMFDLKQADGIGGGLIQAVARCREDFRELTRRLLERLGVPLTYNRRTA